MRTISYGSVIIGIASALIGCGSEAEPANGPVGEVASEAIHHEFQSGGDKVKISSFFGADGSETLMMRVEGSTFRSLVADRLLEKAGPLTFLELFRELAPAGATPDAALVASHAVEAAALGRAGDSVVDIDFDPSEGIEKVSTSACTSFAFPAVSGYTWTTGSKNFVHDTTYTYPGNDSSFMTSQFTGSAICSWSQIGSYVTEQNMWSFNQTSWNYTTATTLNGDTMVGWYMPAGSSRRYGAKGWSGKNINGVWQDHHARAGALLPN
jgi:hypothetical protein